MAMAPAPGTVFEGRPRGRPLVFSRHIPRSGAILFAYIDESGTFDQRNNDLFVYGGLLVPGREAKESLERRYIAVENSIRAEAGDPSGSGELKANKLSMKDRKRLYGVAGAAPCLQFASVVDQRALRPNVFASRGIKQRYLDWALKMGLRRGVEQLLASGAACKDEVEKLIVFVDEHSSSTAGRYNLRESINEEFRHGMYGSPSVFHEPVFSPELPEIPVSYVDSKKVTLIRAVDVTANWIYCAVRDRNAAPGPLQRIEENAKLFWHPTGCD